MSIAPEDKVPIGNKIAYCLIEGRLLASGKQIVVIELNYITQQNYFTT